ncbi:hypothetical protein [Cellulomonas hominis]|uniref:hypothetical protein n=1 Tax=Cellulomonas hominis TaxID=156981 RepID=UPI001443969C|nr:hypothetical protein [Cellulomonas hominis]
MRSWRKHSWWNDGSGGIEILTWLDVVVGVVVAIVARPVSAIVGVLDEEER